MLSKLKIWAMAAGAVLMGILYALFRAERAKRKEAELKYKVADANAKSEEKARQALDYAVRERDKAKTKADEHLQKARQELNDYDDEILNDRLPDNVLSLLNKNADSKRADQDTRKSKG